MTSNYGRELWEKDKAHFLHPWTHFESFNDSGALVIDRGEGPYLYDVDGKRYLDAVGGLWTNSIGLAHEEMVEAIADQARKMAFASTFTDLTNPPAAELGATLADLAPGGLNHVILTTGGSTAIDSAFRLIQFYQNCRGKHDKMHIIARDGSYHGSTYAAMSIGGKKADHVPEFNYIPDIIHHVSCPNYYRAGEGTSESEYLEHLVKELEDTILEIGPDRVAAFFAEPILGAGGVIVPPAGYHRQTWELCKRHDILYVSDEVVTAFGRLGHWFSSKDVFDIEPDLIASAKGITSGYLPLGATLYSQEIHDVISSGDPKRLFTHGFTYSGHPVCCAAALKTIGIMTREGILENARDVGAYFEERLQTLHELPIVGDIRGMKLMMCVENVANKTTKETLPDAIGIGKRIADKCDEMGLIVRPIGHLNVMSPPLTITKDQVDFIVETLGKGIRAVADDLVRSGDWRDPS